MRKDAGKYNFSIKKGAYHKFIIPVTDPDDPNFAFDGTWSAKLEARTSRNASTAAIKLEVSDGITLNGSDVEVEFSTTKTAIDPQKLIWDVYVQDSAGKRYYLREGVLIIKDPVAE